MTHSNRDHNDLMAEYAREESWRRFYADVENADDEARSAMVVIVYGLASVLVLLAVVGLAMLWIVK